MDFLGARIQLNPRPAQQTLAALEVGLLGHAPGRFRVERLLQLPGALAEIRNAGFGVRVDHILALAAELAELQRADATQALINAVLAKLQSASFHLPIPLAASAEFDDIFPDARSVPTQYKSQLAGNSAWLPSAIDDFFANGGEKCWIVRVPEEEGARGFIPITSQPLYDVASLRGVGVLLVLKRIGLIAFPDLERLQIPPELKDIPRLRLRNPEPKFLPVSSDASDGHRERRDAPELINNEPVWSTTVLLRELLAFTSKHRPDIQTLYSLPLAYSASLESPGVDPEVIASLNFIRTQAGAYLLRQVQLVYPYLHNGFALTSAVGVVAGAVAGSARRNGIWRSIGGQRLVNAGRPYPSVNLQQILALRDAPGVGVINIKQGLLQLDDERLMVPALHRNDYVPGEYGEKLNGFRSAEVVRFLGYLMRELDALGERLIFNIDARDPRPRLALQNFFLQLYRAGALRGASAEDAFTITQLPGSETTLAFNIEIAPAYPIDKIVLTFINRNGEWAGHINGEGNV